MWIAELIFALLFGLLLAGVMGLVLGSAAVGGFFWLFAVIFLGAWAIGAWVAPVGPVIMGVAWLPFLLGAVAVALLVGSYPRPRYVRTADEAAVEAEADAALGGFFWAFVVAMLVVILLGSF